MVPFEEVKQIVRDVLQLGAQAANFTRETQLLGAVPEFDSMAVVSVITAIEEAYDIYVDDDEVSAELFETIGSLQDFVSLKLEG